MRKRFYLFLSLIAALGLSVVLTSAFADQKDKAKEKSQNQNTQSKAESDTPQVFASARTRSGLRPTPRCPSYGLRPTSLYSTARISRSRCRSSAAVWCY